MTLTRTSKTLDGSTHGSERRVWAVTRERAIVTVGSERPYIRGGGHSCLGPYLPLAVHVLRASEGLICFAMSSGDVPLA